MSVLETFWLLFDSNAEEVEKGAQQAGKATDDLDERLKRTNISADDLGKKFLQTMKQAVAAFVAFQSVSAAIGGFNASIDYADRLDETSEALGISVEQLDLWGRAAKMAGGSAEGLFGSVKSLSAAMTQLDVTGKSKLKPFFDELGISMTDSAGRARDAMQVLPEIAEAFEKMSKQESIGFGRKLGLDDGTIMLLQKGRREVDALLARQKELGTISKEDAEVAAAYKDSLDELSFAWRAFAVQLGGDVLPIFTRIIKMFTDFGVWAQDHAGFLYGFFGSLAAIMGVFAVKALIAAAAVTVLGFPLYAVLAAIGAITVAVGLLWDDWKKWTEGAPSALGLIWDAFAGLINGIKALWAGLKDYILGIFDALVDAAMFFIDRFSGIRDWFKGDDMTVEAIKKGQIQIGTATNSPIGAQTSNSIMTSKNLSQTNSVSIGEVNINTQATDADGIAGSINQSLDQQLKQVVANSDDGIRG